MTDRGEQRPLEARSAAAADGPPAGEGLACPEAARPEIEGAGSPESPLGPADDATEMFIERGLKGARELRAHLGADEDMYRRTAGQAVADVRGFYTGLGQDPVTATDLQVSSDQLPGRVFGGAVGVHLYPLRKGSFAFGIGGEGVLAGGHAQRAETTTTPAGPIVQQQLRGFSVQISLNFRHRDGWSYLSAGTGQMIFATYLGDTRPADDPPHSSTINLGGGARWFFKSHWMPSALASRISSSVSIATMMSRSGLKPSCL